MEQHLRSLRRQRARGQRRVYAVTAGSAAGATALAAAFGAVLAAGHGPPVAPAVPAQQSSHATDDSATVRSVDVVADLSAPDAGPDAAPNVGKGDPAGVAVTEPPAAQAPARAAEAPAPRLPAAGQAPARTERLKAPAQHPKAAPKEAAQAPTGAS